MTLNVTFDAPLTAGSTQSIAHDELRQASVRELGVSECRFAAGPDGRDGIVLIDFDPELVPEDAAESIAGLIAETSSRLAGCGAWPALRLTGETHAVWYGYNIWSAPGDLFCAFARRHERRLILVEDAASTWAELP